jgi:hypothetical protein
MNTIYASLAVAGAVGLLALSQQPVLAQTADFGAVPMPPNLLADQPGNVGAPTFTDSATGVEVKGLYSTDGGSTWSPANLYRRTQVNDRGLGVCNDVEAGGVFPSADCPGPLEGGDVNELDNAGEDELIVLKLPAGYRWVSVQLSSLDTNDDGPIPEQGQLWADADGIPNGVPGAVGDAVIPTADNPFSGGVQPVEAVINIPPAFESSSYLIFEPYDHANAGASTNNDFLVWKASVESVGGQGCTPGYWKQPHHFDSWAATGYDSDDPFDDTFGVALFPSLTLLDALRQGGGKDRALGRHAVAALLNGSSPDVSYAYSAAEIIAAVQGAMASGDYGTTKDLLDSENNQGCPLN